MAGGQQHSPPVFYKRGATGGRRVSRTRLDRAHNLDGRHQRPLYRCPRFRIVGAQQSLAVIHRGILRPIQAAYQSARFLCDQDARCMVPDQRAVEEQEMQFVLREGRIVVPGAPGAFYVQEVLPGSFGGRLERDPADTTSWPRRGCVPRVRAMGRRPGAMGRRPGSRSRCPGSRSRCPGAWIHGPRAHPARKRHIPARRWSVHRSVD